MKQITLFILLCCFTHLAKAQNSYVSSSRIYSKSGKFINFWKDGEILSPDSMLINGKLPSLMSLIQLKQVLNKPDKISPDPATCCTYWESSDEQNYWYGKTTFLVLLDSAVINEMYFDDDRFFIKTPRITFSKNTTYDEACAVFPVSRMLTKEKERKSNVDDKKTKYICFPVRMTQESDDRWTLYFRDNRLIYIDCSTGGK